LTIRLHHRIEVPRPARDCYRYLADFSTTEQWDPTVYRAAKRTPGAPTVGTEFDLELIMAGRRVPMRYRLDAMAAAARIELTGAGDDVQVSETIALEPRQGRCTIDYRLAVDFDARAPFSLPLLERWLTRMGRRAIAGLRRALTPETKPPVLGPFRKLGDRLLLPGMVGFTERGYRAMPDKGLTEFMDGRQVVITGATGGIGRAAACELARLGAHVAIVGRDRARLETARRCVSEFAGCDEGLITTFEADLAELSQVRRVAGELTNALERIDVLVNNAGALFGERAETSEGHERTLAINLLAPYVLTESLLPRLEADGARVINVASGGMYLQGLKLEDMGFERERFDGAKAYARAKRALVALTEHWAGRHDPGHVTFNSMHPGWAATPGVADALPGFNRAVGPWLRDARMAADTIVWLASARAVACESGRFWFDRRPHPTDVLPRTAVSARQRVQLIRHLERTACHAI